MAKITVSLTLEDGELLDQFHIVSDKTDAVTLSHVIKDVLSWKLEIKDDLSDD